MNSIDFPKMRLAHSVLAMAVDTLEAMSPLPEREYAPDGQFRWVHKDKSVQVLLVVKAARIVSALNAAMCLADAGYVIEAGALARMAKEFALEIQFMAEVVQGNDTKDHQQFLDSFFAEYDPNKKRFYPPRDVVARALDRREQLAGMNAGEMRRLSKELTERLDKNIHGGYYNAMQLYHGGKESFMMTGHDSEEHRNQCKAFLVMLTGEALHAVSVAADAFEHQVLSRELMGMRMDLINSEEYPGSRAKTEHP